jgi:hypothetical protein
MLILLVWRIGFRVTRMEFVGVMPTVQGFVWCDAGSMWIVIIPKSKNRFMERSPMKTYKARLVAQGFTQRPEVDFNKTYSPVINGITFRYLISLAIQKHLSLQLMDVMTAYLYGSLDSDIYMKVSDGISIPNTNANHNMYCVKLIKALYILKQSGRMWHNMSKWFYDTFTGVATGAAPCGSFVGEGFGLLVASSG